MNNLNSGPKVSPIFLTAAIIIEEEAKQLHKAQDSLTCIEESTARIHSIISESNKPQSRTPRRRKDDMWCSKQQQFIVMLSCLTSILFGILIGLFYADYKTVVLSNIAKFGQQITVNSQPSQNSALKQ